MALELKFKISKNADCDTFVFEQNTGAYDVTTNPTGWQTSELSTHQDSYVTITNVTDSIEYDLIEVTSTDVVGDTTNLTYADLIVKGTTLAIGTAQIVDGVYCFEYRILLPATSTIVSTTNYFMSLCALECQLKKLAVKYATNTSSCSPCEDTLLNTFVEAMALYDVLKFSFRCGNFTDFKKILTNLQELLTILDCSNC